MTPQRTNAPHGVAQRFPHAQPSSTPTISSKFPHGPDTPAKRLIGELLVEGGLIDEGQLKRALAVQAEKGGKIVEILITLGAFDTDAFVSFLAQQRGVASLNLSHYEVDRKIVELIPRDLAVKHELFPIDRLGKLLTVGMVCPLDTKTLAKLATITGMHVKPLLCSAKDIRAAIERYYPRPAGVEGVGLTFKEIKGLVAPIRLENVAALIRRLDTLPALPETLRRVQAATLDQESSISDVADIIEQDPSIAAKVLSVANSDAYGFPHRVEDVSLGVTLLGVRETYSIVLSAAVVNLFDKSRHFDYRTFWTESVCCAAAARLIAEATRHKEAGVFSAGLLHDIGRVALSEVIPELYSKVPAEAKGRELMRVEETMLGLSHGEAGFVLAQHWGLPIEIAEPIRYHHRPELAEKAKINVAIVALATEISCISADTVEGYAAVFDNTQVPIKILGLSSETVKTIVADYHSLRDACVRNPIL